MLKQSLALFISLIVLTMMAAVAVRSMASPTVVKSWTEQTCLYIIETDGTTRSCAALPETYYTEWRK